MERNTILIADDESDILDLLEYSLDKEGYKVVRAKDGKEALEKAAKYRPEFFILDIMMPEPDGIEVCRRLRSDAQFSKSIILILTARNEEYSEIAGFDAGADDYIVKPVKIRTLMKRLGALKKRTLEPEQPEIELPPFIIDRNKYTLLKNGVRIPLPRKEFELLYLLASNVNKVIHREKILDKIWGKDVVVVDRTIDVHIRRLRKKIGEDYIETVKGVGYKFVDLSKEKSTSV